MKHLYSIENSKSILILVLLVSICSASCIIGAGTSATVPLSRQKENILYSSNSLNMPILQKKGSGQVNFLGSFGNGGATLNGGEAQVAYAAGKNIGLQVNSLFVGTNNQEPGKRNRAGYIDAAVGYFHGLKNGLTLEIYGGIGTGTTNNEHNTGYSKIKNTKFFLQPSVGFTSMDRKFKFAAGFKLSETKFTIREQAFDFTLEEFNANEFRLLAAHPNQFFIEPSALIRYGWKDFQFQLQYSELIQTGEWKYNMGKSRWNLGFAIPF